MQLLNYLHCSFSDLIFSSNLQLMLQIGWFDSHFCEGVPFSIPSKDCTPTLDWRMNSYQKILQAIGAF